MSTLFGVIIPDERLSLLDFVREANRLLPRFLPEGATDSRQREEVNVRLVRHMTTLGLLDEALREGREARYTGMHLLQLLVVRRLMAEGYTTGAIKKLIAGASVERLEALLEGEAQPSVEVLASRSAESAPHELSLARPSDNAALDFLQGLKQRRAKASDRSPPSSSSPMPATAPPIPEAPRTEVSLRWTRVEVLPGFEVHVREDFALPVTPYEQERLLQRALEELKAIQAGGTPANKRRR